ncbi:Nucleoporin Nup43 [Halotydeus destructor]|nr:Nucleoporin Nup43 [Halotydeus destructor]
MLLEYISSKLSSVRWKSLSSNGTGSNVIIGGTWDNTPCNKVIAWSVNTFQAPTVEIQHESEAEVNSDVNRICTFMDRFAVVSLGSGDVVLFNINDGKLGEAQQWKSIHDGVCTDIVFLEQSKELISCGEDGHLNQLTLDGRHKKCSKISATNLECLDVLSAHEVITGNSAGYLKVYDTRGSNVVHSFAGALQIVTSVKKHPSNPHIVASGNELGEVWLWDLRNSSSVLMKLVSHAAAITDMQYDPRNGNCLYSSSNDGQILKWTIQPDFQIGSLDCIHGRVGGHAISSFHASLDDEICFASDNEVLGFGSL